MGVCNQCQPNPRPAIELAIQFTGKPFREAARTIDDIIGERPMAYQAPIRIAETNRVRDDQFQKAWRRGLTVRRRDCVDIYLRQRGVGLDIYPPCLRFAPADYCYEDDANFLAENYGEEAPTSITYRIPAMVAAITNPDGQHVATHRTFLSTDGRKANVSKQRRVTGKLGKGRTIQLMPTAAMKLGIAEGIETAMSASKLSRYLSGLWSPRTASRHSNRRQSAAPDHLRRPRQTRRRPPRRRSPAQTIIPAGRDQDAGATGADWNDVLLETAR